MSRHHWNIYFLWFCLDQQYRAKCESIGVDPNQRTMSSSIQKLNGKKYCSMFIYWLPYLLFNKNFQNCTCAWIDGQYSDLKYVLISGFDIKLFQRSQSPWHFTPGALTYTKVKLSHKFNTVHSDSFQYIFVYI